MAIYSIPFEEHIVYLMSLGDFSERVLAGLFSRLKVGPFSNLVSHRAFEVFWAVRAEVLAHPRDQLDVVFSFLVSSFAYLKSFYYRQGQRNDLQG